MNRKRVGIVGASGYSGGVLARLVAAHPRFELVFCTSDKLIDRSVGEVLAFDSDLRFVGNGAAIARAGDVDVVALATPAEASVDLAPKFLREGVRVVDLSGAFRLSSPALVRDWYRFEHAAPELLGRAHYGLPEVFGKAPESARLVANPGCYATAAILALAPLIRDRLIEPFGIVVDGKSGVTGAGKQSKEDYSFGELSENFFGYKFLAHQHTPEIAAMLERAGDLESTSVEERVTFAAHLLPLRRGLLVTCYARPLGDAPRIAESLAQAYASSAFVRVVVPKNVTLAGVVGTNRALIGAAVNRHVAVITCSIDNLVKGAAGQAMQNLNAMFGFDESVGLTHLERFQP